MSSPSEATLPASRLRKGYSVPAYGPDATIARTPLVSQDGSMISLVITTASDNSTRLIRVPVDQPIAVRRTPASTPFVRRSSTAKSSGARILLLDLTHPESEVEPVGNQTYATLCVSHHSLHFHTAISTAQAMATHPEEWCSACSNTAAAMARARVYGGIRERTSA